MRSRCASRPMPKRSEKRVTALNSSPSDTARAHASSGPWRNSWNSDRRKIVTRFTVKTPNRATPRNRRAPRRGQQCDGHGHRVSLPRSRRGEVSQPAPDKRRRVDQATSSLARLADRRRAVLQGLMDKAERADTFHHQSDVVDLYDASSHDLEDLRDVPAAVACGSFG